MKWLRAMRRWLHRVLPVGQVVSNKLAEDDKPRDVEKWPAGSPLLEADYTHHRWAVMMCQTCKIEQAKESTNNTTGTNPSKCTDTVAQNDTDIDIVTTFHRNYTSLRGTCTEHDKLDSKQALDAHLKCIRCHQEIRDKLAQRHCLTTNKDSQIEQSSGSNKETEVSLNKSPIILVSHKVDIVTFQEPVILHEEHVHNSDAHLACLEDKLSMCGDSKAEHSQPDLSLRCNTPSYVMENENEVNELVHAKRFKLPKVKKKIKRWKSTESFYDTLTTSGNRKRKSRYQTLEEISDDTPEHLLELLRIKQQKKLARKEKRRRRRKRLKKRVTGVLRNIVLGMREMSPPGASAYPGMDIWPNKYSSSRYYDKSPRHRPRRGYRMAH